jgi:uncharacterized membrane protein
MSTIIHTLHIILAGTWLGGVAFTMTVVSPALKAMKWSEAERISVRSTIGKQYARAGSVNLVLLAIFAVLDGAFRGFGVEFYAEYVLLLLLFGLVAAHGAYFGRRLVRLAETKETQNAGEARAERRYSLQKLSLRVSQLNLLVSVVVMVLAING